MFARRMGVSGDHVGEISDESVKWCLAEMGLIVVKAPASATGRQTRFGNGHI